MAGRSSDSIAILRYTASGVLDPTFSGDGMLVTNLGLPAPGLDSVTLQGGKILVAGQTDHWNDSTKDALLARFTTAGAPDPTFGAGGFVTTDWGGGERYYSVLFGNSRIYAVGGSEDTAGVGRFIVAGYLP